MGLLAFFEHLLMEPCEEPSHGTGIHNDFNISEDGVLTLHQQESPQGRNNPIYPLCVHKFITSIKEPTPTLAEMERGVKGENDTVSDTVQLSKQKTDLKSQLFVAPRTGRIQNGEME